MASAVVTRHSPSRSLREIEDYAVIVGERQQQASLWALVAVLIATVRLSPVNFAWGWFLGAWFGGLVLAQLAFSLAKTGKLRTAELASSRRQRGPLPRRSTR